VAAAIVAGLTAEGERVAAFKPAVSGLDEPTPGWPPDHELLARATGWQQPETVTPHLFGPPVSPHLAAELNATTITLNPLIVAFSELATTSDITIVEGVGGLLVPLADDLSVLDLAKAIDLPVVVATHPDLGTISDTRLTVDRLKTEGLRVAAVVISDWPTDPSDVQLSNRDTLARLTGTDVATLPHTSPATLAEAASDLPVERWLATTR
jgi:dethiobiotin synthase